MGRDQELGYLEREVVTVMCVLTLKGTCVSEGMYSFIYSFGVLEAG